jgi:hypothetical protein
VVHSTSPFRSHHIIGVLTDYGDGGKHCIVLYIPIPWEGTYQPMSLGGKNMKGGQKEIKRKRGKKIGIYELKG